MRRDAEQSGDLNVLKLAGVEKLRVLGRDHRRDVVGFGIEYRDVPGLANSGVFLSPVRLDCGGGFFWLS